MKRIDRVPGGVWITLLFTPWIIYWILCSFDVDIGILLALLLSTIIYTISTDKKSIMTLTTLIYFILASILRFIFRSRFLVEFSGPVGYGVLFIMCILSLIFKRPYTYEVSKRDYPEIYWSSPEFLRIN
ncbi:all-trans-retinol 13,14-reductase, partial [Candidatus Bathyarchaeota archaeon]